jgi:serine/threonine protein kinase
LHEAGFVHGDLKPSHTIITPQGDVVLLDLGSAVERRAAVSTPVTAGYAAPELLAGAAPSVATDLFALGALGHATALGRAPAAGARGLRGQARWLSPKLCDLLEQLLAVHPRDRCADAGEVLARLGAEPLGRGVLPAPLGREHELSRLLTPSTQGVLYLSGPSGVGKSHLLRELWTRALLSGRAARRLSFPFEAEHVLGSLIRFLRGNEAAWPFATPNASTDPMLLLLGLSTAIVVFCLLLMASRPHTATTSGDPDGD